MVDMNADVMFDEAAGAAGGLDGALGMLEYQWTTLAEVALTKAVDHELARDLVVKVQARLADLIFVEGQPSTMFGEYFRANSGAAIADRVGSIEGEIIDGWLKM